MEYQRYKPKCERPFGMGAFFDFGVAMAKHLASRASAGARRKKSPPAPQPPQGVETRARAPNVCWRTESTLRRAPQWPPHRWPEEEFP
jgi:hypothetical protein